MMAWALASIELYYQLFHQRGAGGEQGVTLSKLRAL